MKNLTARSLTRPIAQWAVTSPDEVVMVCGDVQLKRAEWAERVARVAAVLTRAGLASDQRVAILGQNSHRFVEGLYGAMWAGAIAVPLNWRLAFPELLANAIDSEPTVLIADDEFAASAEALASQVSSIRLLILERDYEGMLESVEPMDDAGRSDDDIACLIYTGGTTGRAKGVMLTHTNLVANVENAMSIVPFTRDTVHLHCGALFHLSAMWRVFAVTQCGGKHVVLPRFDAERVLDAFDETHITTAAFVPTMMAALLDSPRFTPDKLSSLRVITYGASPVSETLLEKLLSILPGCGLYQGYGMSETAPAITFSTPADHVPGSPRLRSCGRSVPNVEVRIVGADEEDLAPGNVGEILVRGRTVMRGYWRRPELTEQTLRGGWMHTGDAGRLDDEGYLYIADRLKDMIVTGAENVYSTEVENAIASHPAVSACAVFGIPDEKWGEAVHAVVVPRTGTALTAADVQLHCRALIAGYKCPKSVEIRSEALPLSAVNKVLKASLREKWWAGRERGVA